MMGKPITMDQLRQDVGNMVEKITKVIAIFRQFQLKMEEYVCLKVIAMVSQEGTFIAVKVHSTSVILMLFICSFVVVFHVFMIIFRSWWPQFMRYPRQIPDLFKNIYKKAFSIPTKQGWRVASQIARGNIFN